MWYKEEGLLFPGGGLKELLSRNDQKLSYMSGVDMARLAQAWERGQEKSRGPSEESDPSSHLPGAC